MWEGYISVFGGQNEWEEWRPGSKWFTHNSRSQPPLFGSFLLMQNHLKRQYRWMYNEKVLISKPALDSIGMNTSNRILKIVCVVDRHVFVVHTWIKGKTKMMAKSNITQSLKSNIATPFIGQNGGSLPDSPHDHLLKCCSVSFVVGTNFPKVMSFKILNNNKHKIGTWQHRLRITLD